MTPITRSRFRPRYSSSSFAPGLLFLAGEQGAWYDPSDLSTLFQDAAGTVPVTAVGQSVRLMRDKSGRGNNATAPSDAARPVLQQDGSGLLHLVFNGSSSTMSTGSINFTATNKMTLFGGLTKLSDVSSALFTELSASKNLNAGSFFIAAPDATGASGNFSFATRGTATGPTIGSGTFLAPTTKVLTCIGDISAPVATLRVNGVQAATNTASQGTGNFGNYPLFIGSRNNASLFFNGRLYGLIVRGAATSTTQVTSTERWMAGKTGVTI